jgi:hypothetical protein
MSLLGRLRGLFASGRALETNGASPGGIACHEALERLYEYLDGELTGSTAEEVAAGAGTQDCRPTE